MVSGPWRTNTSAIDRDGWVQPLVDHVLGALGWRPLAHHSDSAGDVVLLLSSVALQDHLPRILHRQVSATKVPTPVWVSRFAGSADFCEKRNFALAVRTAQRLCPSSFAFCPQTWTLPDEMQAVRDYLQANGGRSALIVKPGAGSQGEGIFLVRVWREMEAGLKHAGESTATAVAQEYVERPLLIDNLKFDLRLYVLVLGTHSPRVFLCREGLARFATAEYVDPALPSRKKTWEAAAHLTNYAINRKYAGYIASTDAAGCVNPCASKRALSVLLQQLRAQSALLSPWPFEERELWEALEVMAADVAALLLPALRTCDCNSSDTSPRFQIFGMDVLLDDNYNPRLLEINASPSMRVDQMRAWDPDRDTNASRCSCDDLGGVHVHEICSVDLEVKGKVLGCALQLLYEHMEGESPAMPSMLPFGDPHRVYQELDISMHPVLRLLEPAEALFARCMHGRSLPKSSCLTSVGLRGLLMDPWRELFGSTLPCKKELDVFAGVFRRRRFNHANTHRDDRIDFQMLDLAELLLQLGARQQHLDPATDGAVICQALCEALARQRARCVKRIKSAG